MGILDGLLGNLMGSTQGSPTAQSPIVQMALQVIQQNGGLPGLIGKLQQAGLGQHADSWVSTGQNMPIDASQLQQALGAGSLAQIAQQLGLSSADAGSGLAKVLPQVIDTLTPSGQIPAEHGATISKLLQAFAGRTA